jgi:xanthosine utilization system XapX-like protein
MSKYGKITAGLIAAWFVAIFWASAEHLFVNPGARLGVSIAVAAMAPMIAFSLWVARSDGFRDFALSLNPKVLTSLQAGRIVGFTFVLLEARNVLPAIFAMPAGYGDMFIGATAGFAAWKLAEPARRGSFIFWQVLGILDLVTAVSVGTTAGLLDPHGPSMLPMTMLPLSLIPTFFVPLFLMLHLICIAQARTWKDAAAARRPVAGALQHPAL